MILVDGGWFGFLDPWFEFLDPLSKTCFLFLFFNFCEIPT